MAKISYYAFNSKLKLLKKSDISPVYLFYGKEDYLKNEAICQLEKILVEPELHDLNYSVFYLPDKHEKQPDDVDTSVDKHKILQNALLSCNSLPFLSETKLVVLKNFHNLLESQDSLLEKYIKNPAPTTCLVLVAGEKLPKRKIFQKIEEMYPIINFYNLPDNQLCNWILDYVSNLPPPPFNKQISIDAADSIIKITGNALFDIKNEVDKLILYTAEKSEITIDDVEDCCGHFRQHSVFELLSPLAKKNIDMAIKILTNLFNNGEDEFGLLGVLSDRYRKYQQFFEAKSHGATDWDALKETEIKFFQKEFLDDVRQLEWAEIKSALQQILETEIKMKSGMGGGGGSQVCLEQLVFELCQ
ncbi:MAG: DNA polymerase III subunit delta [Elusimicrobiota bacterium]